MKAPNMSSSKPYLLRALYEWISDNNMTPYVVIDVNVNNIKVPLQYAQNGKIVLDISSTAALNLQIDNDYIRFSARFGNVSQQVIAPTSAVLAIYAQETGAGMMFEKEEETDHDDTTPPSSTSDKPNLKLVK